MLETLAVTIEVTWTAVSVMLLMVGALGTGFLFIIKWANATKYQGRRQKKIIKAIFRQGKAMVAQNRILTAIRSDQKRIMQNMANPLQPTELGDTAVMDAIPEDLSPDGLFTDDDLSDEDD